MTLHGDMSCPNHAVTQEETLNSHRQLGTRIVFTKLISTQYNPMFHIGLICLGGMD